MTGLAGVMGGLLLVAGVGLLVDDRTVLGQSTWLKPAKFASSFIIYALTLAWLLAHLRRARRFARWTANVVAVAGLLEVAAIALQAARGRPSHFNSNTPLDELVWQSMGAFIGVLWVGTLLLAIVLWRERMPDATVTWGVRLGMVLLLAGLLQGGLMLRPTGEQVALDDRGVDTLLGAHAVGVPDGGPGLPLVGWSTTGGDLRVGHFVGIHGLQAMLIVAILVSWLVRDEVRRTRLLFVAAFAYAGLFALVTWQALRGQPVTAPDGATLAALAALAVATAVAAALASLRHTPTSDVPSPKSGRQPMYHGPRR
jgi:hypothetical protein